MARLLIRSGTELPLCGCGCGCVWVGVWWYVAAGNGPQQPRGAGHGQQGGNQNFSVNSDNRRPAGSETATHMPQSGQHGLRMGAALVLSTWIGLAVTAGVLHRLLPAQTDTNSEAAP